MFFFEKKNQKTFVPWPPGVFNSGSESLGAERAFIHPADTRMMNSVIALATPPRFLIFKASFAVFYGNFANNKWLVNRAERVLG